MNIDVIRLAREASQYGESGLLYEVAKRSPLTLERFAALISAEVMEEAAKVCENLPMQQEIDVRDEAAAAIRARKPA